MDGPSGPSWDALGVVGLVAVLTVAVMIFGRNALLLPLVLPFIAAPAAAVALLLIWLVGRLRETRE